MERLGHSDYARLLDFIAALHEPASIEDFGPCLVRLASGLIPGSTIAFDQIDTGAGLYSGFDHNLEIPPEEHARIQGRLQEVYTQNPIYGRIQAGAVAGVADLDDLMPRRAFRRTDFYNDIFRPYGIHHQLCLLLSRPGWIITMTVNHRRPIPEKARTMVTLAERFIRTAHQLSCRRKSAGEGLASNLTPREREVFHWLGYGKRNREIAIILGCSARTVEKHVESILAKTGTETRTAAVESMRRSR